MGIIINGLTDTVTAADGSLNIGGDVTIPGELSYDDVTNVDSVGIITAQSGIKVTSGDILLTGGDGRKISFAGDGSAHYFKMDNTLNGPIINGYGGIAFETYGANERLRITSSGNVGIGTDNPTETLTLNHVNGASIGLEYGGSEHGSINVNSAAMYVRAGTGKHLILGGNATEALRLTSGGRIGIGMNPHTSSTGYALQIDGGASSFIQIFNDTSGNTVNDGLVIGNDANTAYLVNKENTPLVFRTNNTERLRITSAGRIGINQISPDAMLQVDYDEGSSEVGLRLRAYNASGSKTWQLSEINGTPGVFTIRNATNSQNNLSIDGSSGYVGVNATNPERRLEVVDTNSNGSYPLAVSNFINATANKGAAIDFRLTTGGNTRGEIGCKWASNSSSDGTDLYFAPNDGSTGNVERLRIKSNSQLLHTRSDNTTRYDLEFRQTGGISGGNYGGIHWTQGSTGSTNLGAIEINYADTGRPDIVFKTRQTGGNAMSEAARIDSVGRFRIASQPAFNAKLSTATGANFNGMIAFNSIDHNVGSHYNGSNGRFTAPLAGRYLFNFYTNVYRDGGSGSLWADWYVNNSAKGFRMYTQYNSGWELVSGSIILSLSQNDYVQVYAGTSGNWDGGSYGSFNGYLLG